MQPHSPKRAAGTPLFLSDTPVRLAAATQPAAPPRPAMLLRGRSPITPHLSHPALQPAPQFPDELWLRVLSHLPHRERNHFRATCRAARTLANRLVKSLSPRKDMSRSWTTELAARFPGVSSLHLNDGLTNAFVRRVIQACSQLALTNLLISMPREPDLPALKQLTQLKQLELDGAPCVNVGDLADLLRALPLLQALKMMECSFTGEATVDLTGAAVSELTLGRSPHDQGWEDTDGYDIVAAALARLPDLTVLALSNMPKDSTATETLLQQATGIASLELGGTGMPITPVVAAALHALPQLRSLWCYGFDIADVLPLLTALSGLTKLELLELQDDGEADIPAATMALPHLRHLELEDVGLEPLTCLSTLTALTELHLTKMDFDEDEMDACLAAVARLPDLKRVVLTETNVSAAGMQSLRSRSPAVEVYM